MPRIAVMQPYLFPYLGYFHLMHAVDRFIVLDDVNYIPRGWINRNAILAGGRASRFSIPVRSASQNRKINELERGDDVKWRSKFLRRLESSYRKAPCFAPTMSLVTEILESAERHLATWLVMSLRRTCVQLGLDTDILPTTVPYDNHALKAEQRIVDICRRENAGTYVNLIGGRSLYDVQRFAERSVQLRFTRSRFPPYRQFKHDFVPGLSILDVLMFNDTAQLRVQLSAYDLE